MVCILAAGEAHVGYVACASAACCRIPARRCCSAAGLLGFGLGLNLPLNHAQVMFMVCVGNARPELPQGMPPAFLQLLTDCWCAQLLQAQGLGFQP